MSVIEVPWDDVVFEMPARSGKLRCRACGAVGWPNQAWDYDGRLVPSPHWWGTAHERGHPWTCTDCPRVFTTPNGLSHHRRSAHP